MDMEIKDKDLLIKNFMLDNLHEIKNNGFSKGVLRKLPEAKKQKNYNWIVLLMGFLGLIVSILFGIDTGGLQELLTWILNIPILYFSFAVFCIPIVTTTWYFLFYERKFGII